jgi:peptidoglycan-N-acetylglucosamine deacetylase
LKFVDGHCREKKLTNTSKGWGPDRKRAAVNITFDNMGEVAERRLGLEPIMADSGKHLSIEILPRLLKMLENTPITYFIEGENTKAYPEAVKSVRDAGHEIGAHGWFHENWATTPVPDRRRALQEAVEAFRKLGVDVLGFRPPGGEIDLAELKPELNENQLAYASPLGEEGADRQQDQFVSLPFAWRHVDAYVLHPELGALRKMYGDPEKPYSNEHWRETIERTFEKIVAEGSHATLIFHPFILGRDQALIDVFDWAIKAVDNSPDIWAPTCVEMSSWAQKEKLFAA